MQKQIAEDIGVNHQTLNRMLTGTRKMSAKVQLKLWLHADPDTPVTEDNWREVFKQARVDQGMTMYVLRNKAGYRNTSGSIISGYEDGTAWPKLKQFLRLAEVLGVTLPEPHKPKENNNARNSNTTKNVG